jgi:AraC-like DNA-binding protein
MPLFPLVLALVLGDAERGRVRAALRARYRVRFLERMIELSRAALSADDPLAAVIVEARDIDGRSTAETVRQLRDAAIALPIIAYCRTGAEHTTDTRALVGAGVHELLYEGINDSGVALRTVLESALLAMLGERAAAAFIARLPERLWGFVKQVTAHPETQRVAALADALGCDRKTLVNHCKNARTPPPRELLAWCRLAVVAELLTSTTETVESIAFQLEFPSDTALRNMIKRYTGLRASDVRAQGGMQCILKAFDKVLRERGALSNVASKSSGAGAKSI